MGDAEEYRKYAEECERLARTAPEPNKAALLEIAKAWRQVLAETESRDASRKGEAQPVRDDTPQPVVESNMRLIRRHPH